MLEQLQKAKYFQWELFTRGIFSLRIRIYVTNCELLHLTSAVSLYHK